MEARPPQSPQGPFRRHEGVRRLGLVVPEPERHATQSRLAELDLERISVDVSTAIVHGSRFE